MLLPVYRSLLTTMTTLSELLASLFSTADRAARRNCSLEIKALVDEACISLLDSPDADCTEFRVQLEDFSRALSRAEDFVTLQNKSRFLLRSLSLIRPQSVTKQLLRRENRMPNYIQLLRAAANDGLYILLATSTPSCSRGSFFRGIKFFLSKLGMLDPALAELPEFSYTGIMSQGRVLSENYTADHPSRLICEAGSVTLDLCGSNSVAIPSIDINGREWAVNAPGIAVVVYEPDTDTVWDAVTFGIGSSGITALRDPGVLISEHPDVTFIRLKLPTLSLEHQTQFELELLCGNITRPFLVEHPEQAVGIMRDIGNDREGVLELLSQPPLYRKPDGARAYVDFSGAYLNCRNGRRVTEDQPAEHRRTIYAIGGCTFLGVGVRDRATFCSQLQAMLNARAPAEGFIVENCSTGLKNLNEGTEYLQVMQSLPLKSGDIVLSDYGSTELDVLALHPDPYKYGELFWDSWNHLTAAGNKITAECIFSCLAEHHFFPQTSPAPTCPPPPSTAYTRDMLSPDQLSRLKRYQRELFFLWETRTHYSDDVGAVVMNCNPFTLGHRYLVETCARACEYLILFVVQEDRSVFPFSDRLALVQEGVRDLPNVIVVPSGEFVISHATFEGYFNKESLQEQSVDSSLDVTIFSREIAPAAHIKTRFVGTEPVDRVTWQYNRTLKELLPCYGIRLTEIPRREADGAAISASTVRKLLDERNWPAIRRLVPDVTYAYLRGRFSP